MSRPRLRAVLFDLDGTLLDTAPDFATVTNRLLAEEGCGPMAGDAVRAAVSGGSRALVERAFGISELHPEFGRLRARLLELYAANLMVDTAPFPGVIGLLAALGERGLIWGVVTNKPEWLAAPLLERAALDPPLRVLVCPEHVTRTKPDPEPLLLACSRLGCEPAEAVYLGDHLRDIEAGRRAGMATIAAGWGYLGPGESVDHWRADHAADSVQGAQRILFEHFLDE
jgi:N-acetyl-D-muramate 6-phosphate phosphatase